MRRRLLTVLVGILPVLAGLGWAMVPAGAAGQAPLPQAEDIVARHVKAIGGAEAWRRVQSVRMTGTFEMPGQGLSGDLQVYASRPSSVLLRVNIAGLGPIESGFNGTHAWSIDPTSGASLKTGRELQETKDEAHFDSTLFGPEHVKSMTVAGVEDFDNRKAYKVQVVLQSGTEQVDYFDVELGHQIGSESRRQTPMGELPTVSVLREYKPFGEVRQPTVLVQRLFGIEQVLRLTTVEFNGVPANAFDPPAEIKALIKSPGPR